MVRLTAKTFYRLVGERLAFAFAESAGAGVGQVFAAWVQAKVFPEDELEQDPESLCATCAKPNEEE